MQNDINAWSAGACQLTTYDICIAMTLACLKGNRINHRHMEVACTAADNAIRLMIHTAQLEANLQQD